MSNVNEFLFGNDEYEIIRITKEYYEVVWELFHNHFLPHESVSIATNLLGQQQTINEMQMLLNTCLDDGISFAARHIASNQLVGLAANKFLNTSGTCSLNNIFDQFKTPNMAAVGRFLDRLEKTHNLFEEWNIDCLVEIVFLSTHTNFGQQGIALNLAAHTVRFARNVLRNEIAELELLKLPQWTRNEKPKAVCATFTSLFTQKIGEKLNFTTINQISNNEFSFNGKTFAENISSIHKYSTYAALKIF